MRPPPPPHPLCSYSCPSHSGTGPHDTHLLFQSVLDPCASNLFSPRVTVELTRCLAHL